jgi:ankyrin repeat protein
VVVGPPPLEGLASAPLIEAPQLLRALDSIHFFFVFRDAGLGMCMNPGASEVLTPLYPSAIARRRFDESTRPVAGFGSVNLVAWAAGVIIALLVACAAPAVAHESEQYTVPVGRDFADLGPYFSRIVHDAVVAAVAATNAEITKVVEDGESRLQLNELQSPAHIAYRVWEQLFMAMPANELLDLQLISESVLSQYPGLITVHQPARSIYNDPLLVIDLTKVVRTFFRAGSVSSGGTVFGTDKIIHFINVGRVYHAKYETRRQRGLSTPDATRSALASAARNPLFSEDGVLGMWTTGIRSNGDLAADYAGLRFYRNLTEEVRIGRRIMPPMLVREGELWRVRIEPDSDFFTAFITPHWNETLNPNKYVGYTRVRIRSLVRERCAETLDWYRDERGQPMGKAQFEAIERELATYFGEDYQHRSSKDPVSVASVCFATSDATPVSPAPAADAASERSDPGPDALRRSVLWWAARNGDGERVQAMALQPEEINAPDHDGETPLHAAIRGGSEQVVQELLARGADPNRLAVYGVTPLMLASAGGKSAIATLLLRAGAQANQRDLFGKTALFDAALRGNSRLTALLLDNGADLRLADDAGNTALHFAARGGSEAVVTMLLARAADANVRNAAGASPQTEARKRGHASIAERLRPDGASLAGPGPAAMASEESIANGGRPVAEPLGPRDQ